MYKVVVLHAATTLRRLQNEHYLFDAMCGWPINTTSQHIYASCIYEEHQARKELLFDLNNCASVCKYAGARLRWYRERRCDKNKLKTNSRKCAHTYTHTTQHLAAAYSRRKHVFVRLRKRVFSIQKIFIIALEQFIEDGCFCKRVCVFVASILLIYKWSIYMRSYEQVVRARIDCQ